MYARKRESKIQKIGSMKVDKKRNSTILQSK